MKKQYSFEPSCNGSYEVFTYIKCEPDSDACSHGYVFVDNTCNNEICKFSPQNIDKYIKVECDDGIEPPILIKRFIAYAVLDIIKRS